MAYVKNLLEEQFLIKYCVIKDLMQSKIRSMMDIKGILLQWFISFFDTMTAGGAVKNEIM